MSIYNITGEQLLAISWLIATESVQGISLAEQEVLGHFFVSLGENILLIRAQNELRLDVRNERNLGNDRNTGSFKENKKNI